MSKPVLGLILGAILGVFDGLTALLEPDIATKPDVGAAMTGILIGSSFKGLLAGFILGFIARKVNSLPKLLAFGFAIGLFFAFIIALLQYLGEGKGYWLQIMLPGSIVGIILGYATHKYGKEPQPAAAN
jgi:uncharacterized membrane protein